MRFSSKNRTKYKKSGHNASSFPQALRFYYPHVMQPANEGAAKILSKEILETL
jgi:hypothetical protein